MKVKIKDFLKSLLKFLPLAVVFVFMGIYLFSGKDISAEYLSEFAPEDPFKAALFLISLYALKSLTVFFPIMVLTVLGGFLFDPVTALVVNSAGVVVELIIPYFIGKYSRGNLNEKLAARFSKFQKFTEAQEENQWFVSFFLRIISCFPTDLVSIYLGRAGVPMGKFLIPSYLGVFPALLFSTLIGSSITDPASPMFWVSVIVTVGLSIISIAIYKSRKNG